MHKPIKLDLSDFKINLHDHVVNLLTERHVKLADLAEIVYNDQQKYNPDISRDFCLDAIDHVLQKREVQNIIMLGIYMDKQTDIDKNMDPYLRAILLRDEGLFQCDEALSTAITEVFGGIASSNRGYLDKTKPGIIGQVDRRTNSCNVFLDDILAAIVAAAESYVANKKPYGVYKEMEF